MVSGKSGGWGAVAPFEVLGVRMTDPLSRAERNRKEAAKFADLAKSTSSSFLRGYYQRIADRYLLLEGEWRPPGRQGTSISKQGGLSASSAAGHALRP